MRGNGHFNEEPLFDIAAGQRAIAEDRTAGLAFLNSGEGFGYWEALFRDSLAAGDPTDKRAQLIERACVRLLERTSPIVHHEIFDWAARHGEILFLPDDLTQQHLDAAQRNAKPYTPPPVAEDRHWPRLHEAALYGLAGDVVETIAPHTEGDLAALLIQYLTAVGNVIGKAAYYQVEADRHYPRLFTVLVGDTGKGRKGTSLGQIRRIIKQVDEPWAEDRVKNGLSSGEGLIFEVRDKVEKNGEVVDAGAPDKRLLVVEPEFAGRWRTPSVPATICPRKSGWHGTAESWRS
jgi:hypothetical protein